MCCGSNHVPGFRRHWFHPVQCMQPRCMIHVFGQFYIRLTGSWESNFTRLRWYWLCPSQCTHFISLIACSWFHLKQNLLNQLYHILCACSTLNPINFVHWMPLLFKRFNAVINIQWHRNAACVWLLEKTNLRMNGRNLHKMLGKKKSENSH